MNTVKLSTKGQIILPKEIRNNLKLEPGTYFNIKTEKSNIILTIAIALAQKVNGILLTGDPEIISLKNIIKTLSLRID